MERAPPRAQDPERTSLAIFRTEYILSFHLVSFGKGLKLHPLASLFFSPPISLLLSVSVFVSVSLLYRFVLIFVAHMASRCRYRKRNIIAGISEWYFETRIARYWWYSVTHAATLGSHAEVLTKRHAKQRPFLQILFATLRLSFSGYYQYLRDSGFRDRANCYRSDINYTRTYVRVCVCVCARATCEFLWYIDRHIYVTLNEIYVRDCSRFVDKGI